MLLSQTFFVFAGTQYYTFKIIFKYWPCLPILIVLYPFLLFFGLTDYFNNDAYRMFIDTF